MRKITHTRWQAATPGVPDRLNLMGLRFVTAGDGGDAGAGGQGGDGQPAGTPTPTPGDLAAKAAAAQQHEADKPGDNLPDDPAALKAEIARLRKENAGDRTAAKAKAAEDAQAALTQQIGKALGLIKDEGETPDPAALTAQITEQQATAKQAQLELAVFRNAGAKNADPNALLDSRSFLDSVKDIDPTDTSAIQAAIGKAVQANTKLQAVQVAGSNSVQHPGGSGERGAKPKSLAAAVNQHYGQ